MKNLMVLTHTSTRLTARLFAIVLFAALLFAVPFHSALAAPALGPAESFAVLSGSAVTCTGSTVTGDVGLYPVGSITDTGCTINNGVVDNGNAAADAAYTAFLSEYNALESERCGTTLSSGNLAGLTLSPGVYCVTGASTTTSGTLTLNGPSNGVWIFKIGTGGTGTLTGTGLSVVMTGGGSPCNVYWWVAQAATMTTSAFQGTILAGAAITLTGPGTFDGDVLAKAAVTLSTDETIVGCKQAITPPSEPCQPCNCHSWTWGQSHKEPCDTDDNSKHDNGK